MNYRHAFHAGNFADVHKHLVLIALLEHLHKKPAPFFVLDTHAGRGIYDLRSNAAERGGEWQDGIGRLRTQATAPAFARYLELVGSAGNSYPGSPLLIAAMLRESDRAVFVEKHPEETLVLRGALGRRGRISIIEGDGYAGLTAQLPPKENRGLVLIDPPYESDKEFAIVAQSLTTALKRWSNGTYCLWFPIKPDGAEQRLYRTLTAAKLKKILIATVNVRPSDSPLGLNGSGLLIVNPPWQLDVQLLELLPKLHRVLSPDGAGGTRVEWLAGE